MQLAAQLFSERSVWGGGFTAKYLAIPSTKVSGQLNSGPDSAYFFMLLIWDIANVCVGKR